MKAVRIFAIPAALLALGATCAFGQYKVRPDIPLSAKDLSDRIPAQLVGVGIEEHLGRKATYPGRKAFHVKSRTPVQA